MKAMLIEDGTKVIQNMIEYCSLKYSSKCLENANPTLLIIEA
jgi:hypothetical protein